MIKAVLFDLDGTLLNTLDDLGDSTNYALGLYGLPSHSIEEYKYFVGNGMRKLIERAVPQGSSPQTVDKVFDAFMEYYGKHYADKTAPYDGAVKMLNDVKSKGKIIAVITNKADSSAQQVVADYFGKDLFNLVFGQREGIPTKPDPTLTLMAMKELGVTPQECIFVGDSGMDVATGVNSGAYPVGVLWGFRKADELMENGAKRLISAPSELLGIIEELD